MRRDFNLIEKVILRQRKKIRSTLAKFYRMVKITRKEVIGGLGRAQKLKPFLEKQILEAVKALNVTLTLNSFDDDFIID